MIGDNNGALAPAIRLRKSTEFNVKSPQENGVNAKYAQYAVRMNINGTKTRRLTVGASPRNLDKPAFRRIESANLHPSRSTPIPTSVRNGLNACETTIAVKRTIIRNVFGLVS